jgi:hypothetical protein
MRKQSSECKGNNAEYVKRMMPNGKLDGAAATGS